MRPVTLFTGQFAGTPLATLADSAKGWGYDGLELACWGDHMDVIKAAGEDGQEYCDGQLKILTDAGLQPPYAISQHLAGQNVGDVLDARHLQWAGTEVTDAYVGWITEGNAPPRDNPYYIPPEIAAMARQWGIEQMMAAPTAAARMGADVVCGFMGSSTWHLVYPFPPFPEKIVSGDTEVILPDPIERGLETIKERWWPILDEMTEKDKKFALEVHDTEVAFDLYSAEALLKAVPHPALGFNFDPSHLYWQGVDPVEFIRAFPEKIFHVHMKDVQVTLGGRQGILSSHLPFGDHRRGWEFRSVGRGHVDFEAIMAALNDIGYKGPLSAEWEDDRMDPQHGAPEACRAIRRFDFPPNTGQGFDAAFARQSDNA